MKAFGNYNSEIQCQIQSTISSNSIPAWSEPPLLVVGAQSVNKSSAAIFMTHEERHYQIPQEVATPHGKELPDFHDTFFFDPLAFRRGL